MTVTDEVGRRVPKGYYIKINKGTSKQLIKQMLFTRFDYEDYSYDYAVDKVFKENCYRDVFVLNEYGIGYSWYKGMDLTKYKEFFYCDIGKL